MEEVGKPLTSRQIAEGMECDMSAIRHTLNKLLKHKEIFFKELDRIKAAEVLGVERITRRMRFFYITLPNL